jgi:hypothetical protein
LYARADSGWDIIGIAIYFGALPFFAVAIGLVIYVFVSKVSIIQKVWLVLLFLLTALITSVLEISRALTLLPYFEAVLMWIFPLCACMIFSKCANRDKKENQ